MYKYIIKLQKFTKKPVILNKFLAHAGQKNDDDKEEDKEDGKEEEVKNKDQGPDWRKTEFKKLYDKDSKLWDDLNRHIGMMKGTFAKHLRSK